MEVEQVPSPGSGVTPGNASPLHLKKTNKRTPATPPACGTFSFNSPPRTSQTGFVPPTPTTQNQKTSKNTTGFIPPTPINQNQKVSKNTAATNRKTPLNEVVGILNLAEPAIPEDSKSTAAVKESSPAYNNTPPGKWKAYDVRAWVMDTFTGHNYGQTKDSLVVYCVQQNVNGKKLLGWRDAELRSAGLQSIPHRKQVLDAIAKLVRQRPDAIDEQSLDPSPPPELVPQEQPTEESTFLETPPSSPPTTPTASKRESKTTHMSTLVDAFYSSDDSDTDPTAKQLFQQRTPSKLAAKLEHSPAVPLATESELEEPDLVRQVTADNPIKVSTPDAPRKRRRVRKTRTIDLAALLPGLDKNAPMSPPTNTRTSRTSTPAKGTTIDLKPMLFSTPIMSSAAIKNIPLDMSPNQQTTPLSKSDAAKADEKEQGEQPTNSSPAAKKLRWNARTFIPKINEEGHEVGGFLRPVRDWTDRRVNTGHRLSLGDGPDGVLANGSILSPAAPPFTLPIPPPSQTSMPLPPPDCSIRSAGSSVASICGSRIPRRIIMGVRKRCWERYHGAKDHGWRLYSHGKIDVVRCHENTTQEFGEAHEVVWRKVEMPDTWNDIMHVPKQTASFEELKRICVEVGGVGFNEAGWIKHTIRPPKQFQTMRGMRARFGTTNNGHIWVRETATRRWDGLTNYGNFRKLDPTTSVYMDVACALMTCGNEENALKKINQLAKLGHVDALINYRSSHRRRKKYGAMNTLLHFAARANYVKTAERLLALGLDINVQRKKDLGTALHLACWHGHRQMAECLIENNADVTIRNKYNELPPLWRLMRPGDYAKVKAKPGSSRHVEVVIEGMCLDDVKTANDEATVRFESGRLKTVKASEIEAVKGDSV